MRYGSPSIASAVQELREWGADRLLVFPMYPHNAGPTTASTYDEVFRQLAMLRFVPSLRVSRPITTIRPMSRHLPSRFVRR